MAAKAKLTVVLKADETIVAEIEDAALWQRVLAAMSGGATTLNAQDTNDLSGRDDIPDSPQDARASVAMMAKRLGMPAETVVGALSPSKEPPYLHLNPHNWEAFKKQFPKRGPGSVSPIGLAGTALALWFKEAKIDLPATQSLAAAVLDTINIKDPNPSRGIKNTKWLQARAGGVIILNPAEISKAQEIVQAFCLKKAPSAQP